MLPISHTITPCDRDRIYSVARLLETSTYTIEDILKSTDGETGEILDAIELLGFDVLEAIVAYVSCDYIEEAV